VSVKVWLQVQVWPGLAHPVARSVPQAQAQAKVSPWAPALDGPEELLPVAAVAALGEPRAAAVWVRAAAEPRRAAVPGA
jgi:hypothetical protein